MKTSFYIFLAIAAMIVALVAAFAESGENNNPAIGVDYAPLDKIVDRLYENVDVPPYEITDLDQENFEYYSFIPYDESLFGVAADALVRIEPHSTVVIRADNGNGPELAYKIIANADPNKWISVGAEVVNVAYTYHYVILVMSYQDTADAIIHNFKNMAEDLDGMEMALLTAHNPRFEQDFWEGPDSSGPDYGLEPVA